MSAIGGNTRPVALPVVAENIPDALTQIARWVVWKYVPDTDRETGVVSWDKPPVCARNGGAGSSTNPATWAAFVEALSFHSEMDYDGVGFVLHHAKGANPHLVAIDLDKCRDPQTGVIDEWAMKIIMCINSYTEVSPSGKGIRIFLYGALPPFGRKKGPYENYESGRYVTVTGQHIDGTPKTIEHRQEELLAVHKEKFGERVETLPKGNGTTAALDLDNRALLEKAFKSRNGSRIKALFNGDTSGYPSRSEADLALCNYLAFWFGRNADRIMQVITESGLYRTKWQREDYRDRTIGKAIASCSKVYEPRERSQRANVGSSSTAANNGQHSDGDGCAPRGDAQPPGVTPSVEAAEQPPSDPVHLTDRGNAIRLAQEFGKNLRHEHTWSKWLVWDGCRWAVDDVAQVKAMAKTTIVHLFREAQGRIEEIRRQLEDMSNE